MLACNWLWILAWGMAALGAPGAGPGDANVVQDGNVAADANTPTDAHAPADAHASAGTHANTGGNSVADTNVIGRAQVGDGNASLTREATLPVLPVVLMPPPPPVTPWADPNIAPMDPNIAVHPGRLRTRPYAEAVQRAARLVARSQHQAAMDALQGLEAPAVALVRARALRGLGKWAQAEDALARVRAAPLLSQLWQLEDGLLAAAQDDAARAQTRLLPLVREGGDAAGQAVLALLPQLAQHDPNVFLAQEPALRAALPGSDGNAKSIFLQAHAGALERAGQPAAALLLQTRCFVQEPVSLMTPAAPPAGVTLDANQWLERAQRLLEANRNDRALAALQALEGQTLPAPLACTAAFTRGLAQRKQRRYMAAEEALSEAMHICTDVDLVRRAAYLRVKVISIRDGLRAIEPIEAFVKAYPRHTMTDDVLFWAGDMYQRRNRFAEARAFYQRVDALPVRDDYCAESRFRLGWMHLKENDWAGAVPALERMLLADGCVTDPHDQSRARYWLGWVYEQTGARDKARAAYRAILDAQPLSFYAQQALPRLLALQPEAAREATSRAVMAPLGKSHMALCPAGLAWQPDFVRALALLEEGLGPDAARILLRLSPSAVRVVGSAEATSLGERAKVAQRAQVSELHQCGPAQAALLLVLLLDRAGAQHEAHWRLRTVFGDEFGHFPTPEEMVLWRAAYPLAFRDVIAAAEHESGLPKYFLQALSREESAFDPFVVSWAEAYGLTQLLLTSAQDAGRRLQPPVRVTDPEQLLDAAYNARLGGALLGSMLRHFQGNAALALTAYNAGGETGNGLWQRYQHQTFSVYAEELPIQETRGYVKRVLRTYGIYRWLYASALPALAIEPTLPVKP